MTASCESESLLQAYIDQELAAEEVAQVEAHLATCGDCQEAADELRALGGQLSALFGAREQEAVQVSLPGVPAASQASAKPAAAAAQTAVAQTVPAVQGAVAGGYRVVAEIAKGGFGTVYKAIQLSMDRPVALKILAPHLAENQEFVARFLREARVAATITHPNLVTIFDVGQSGARLYYSMELIEGEDVEALLHRDGFVPPQRAVEIALGVAQALVAAKQAGVIHRDIKPANIMVTPAGQIKLADLGLAKALEEPQDSRLTVRKKVIGSPNYMSPEQAKDLRQATHVSDVYSLGATLLHMISGQKPFGSGSPVEIISRVLKDPLELPAMTPGGEKVSPALAELIGRAMAKDPSERFADAVEMAAALEGYLSGTTTVLQRAPAARVSGRGSGTGRVSGQGRVGKRASVRSARKVKGPSGEVPTRRVPQRSQSQWGMAAAAAVVMGVGLVIAVATRGGSTDTTPVASVTPVRPSARPSARPPVRRVSDSPATPAPQRGAAELAMADLQTWVDANPGRLGERYRRAKDVVDTWPDSTAAKGAREVCDQAEDELRQAYADANAKAQGFEDTSRWYAAKRVYLAFVDEHGDEVPGAVEAEVAVVALETQIEVKLESDRTRLMGLLEQGAGEEADALVLAIARYAGADEQSRAQAKVEEFRRNRPDPAPTPEEDQRLAHVRGLVAQVRHLIDGKDFGGALVKLGQLKKAVAELGQAGEALSGEIAKLEQELEEHAAGAEPKPDHPQADLGELVKAYFHGDVTRLEGQSITIVYDFSQAEQAEDFMALPGPPGKNSPKLYKWLRENTKSSRTEPWSVKAGRLVGYGWTRAGFVAKLQTRDPIHVEVTARGGENMLIGLGESYQKAVLAGLGYLLPELPISKISNEIPKGDGRNNYLQRLNRRVSDSRERGLSLAVLREGEGLLNLRELVAQAMKPKRKMTFAVDVEPDGEHFALTMRVGRGEVEPVEAELGSKATLFLTTMGSAVQYDDLTISGTLSDEFVELLKQAAEKNDGKADGIREAVDELVRERREARQKREEAERERKAEERRRKEEERERDGGGDDDDHDDPDGEGGDDGDDDEGDEGDDDGGGDAVDDLWGDWEELSAEERQKRLRELSEEDRQRLRERWDKWRDGGGRRD